MKSYFNHMQSWFKGLQGSIFARLLLIFFVTALAIIVTLTISFSMATLDGDGSRKKLRKQFRNHVAYLVQDIGVPPDLQRAGQISEDLNVDIMISGPQLLWKSSPSILSPDDIRQRPARPRPRGDSSYDSSYDSGHDPGIGPPPGLNGADVDRPRVFNGRHHQHRFLIVEQGGVRFYFSGPRFPLDELSTGWIALGLCVSVLLVFACYRMVKWLFRPLEQIKQGALMIRQGDLSYRLETGRTDEIGTITLAVNEMASDLEAMLEAKRQLLLAISHELRTPLTRARLGLEFIDDQLVRASLAEDLDELESLISELLETERLNQPHGVLQCSSFVFADFVKDVLAGYPQQQYQLSLAVDDESEVVSDRQHQGLIEADALRVKLLIKNIMSNAIKYGKDQPIQVQLWSEQGQYHLRFIDHGEGIDERHLSHLTEPFYRADSARQRETGGYGLGLHLCLLIVQAHGGQLLITSKRGEGTQVEVSLPHIASSPRS